MFTPGLNVIGKWASNLKCSSEITAIIRYKAILYFFVLLYIDNLNNSQHIIMGDIHPPSPTKIPISYTLFINLSKFYTKFYFF